MSTQYVERDMYSPPPFTSANVSDRSSNSNNGSRSCRRKKHNFYRKFSGSISINPNQHNSTSPFTQISTLKEDIAELHKDKDLLTMQLNESVMRTRAISGAFTDANSEMDREAQINEHLERTVKEMQIEIAKLRKEIKSTTSRNQDLHQQLEKVNGEYFFSGDIF